MNFRQVNAGRAYLKAIRAPLKKAYAEAYWQWLAQTKVYSNPSPEPERPAHLSAMAAQAVRMNLSAIALEGIGKEFS